MKYFCRYAYNNDDISKWGLIFCSCVFESDVNPDDDTDKFRELLIKHIKEICPEHNTALLYYERLKDNKTTTVKGEQK